MTFHPAETLSGSPALRDQGHGRSTRIVHAGLAAAIVAQLVSSQVMNPDGAGNSYFALHRYSGLAAFGLIVAFWGLAAWRRRGTPVSLLVPWFSGRRLRALWADIQLHMRSLLRLSLPPHAAESAMASAIHGLGLLLITVMAASGTQYYFINTGDPDAGGLIGLTMTVHKIFANLVWVYLIGHAGMAVVAHFGGTLSLRHMWSVRQDN